MKIILGSCDPASNHTSKGKRNGLMSVPNGGIGICSATSALRTGLSALKAAGGKRFFSDEAPLVSASSMAVPSLVLHKKESGKILTQAPPLSQTVKKETQL
jgi:hypothetical protein